MILAIIERIEDIKEEKPFNNRFYVTKHYKDIFDKLNILLFPIISEKNLEKVCEICDGLIVTGSAIDINPKYYKEEPIQGKKYDVDEFKLDKKAINLFANENKPILGICGGLQAINVTFGGSLYQYIPNHNLCNSKHKIKIIENTYLKKLYDNNIEINSYHFQAVKNVAPLFKISAVSEDGVVEAIEKENIIGVQWHPEEMKDTKFFEMFIQTFFKRE